MNIFISRNGNRQGPYSIDQLKTLIGRGEYSLSDKVWYEGAPGWVRISEMPELIDTIVPPLPLEDGIPAENLPPTAPTIEDYQPKPPSGPCFWWPKSRALGACLLILYSFLGCLALSVMLCGNSELMRGFLETKNVRLSDLNDAELLAAQRSFGFTLLICMAAFHIALIAARYLFFLLKGQRLYFVVALPGLSDAAEGKSIGEFVRESAGTLRDNCFAILAGILPIFLASVTGLYSANADEGGKARGLSILLVLTFGLLAISFHVINRKNAASTDADSGEFAGAVAIEAEQAQPAAGAPTKWYYLVGEQTCGPSATEEVRSLLASGSIPNATYLFRDGLTNWTKAYDLAEFQEVQAVVGQVAVSATSETSGNSMEFVPPSMARPAIPPQPAPKRVSPVRPDKPSLTPLRPSGVQRSHLFVWWPASVVGSAVLAAVLAYFSNSLVAIILVMVSAFQGAEQFPTGVLLSAVGSVGLLLIIYLGAIFIRQMMVAAPYKRQLHKRGINYAQHKPRGYDFVLENHRTFVVTGLVVAGVMLWQIIGITSQINSLKAALESKGVAAQSLQATASSLADEKAEAYKQFRKWGNSQEDAERAAEEYVAMKHPEAASSSEMLSKGVGLLSGATADAFKISVSRGLRVWEGLLAVLALAFSGYVRSQARKEHEEQAGRGS